MLRIETVEQRTLDILKQCMALESLDSFVLVGGTALALQFGHRKSIDLDFFGNVQSLETYEILEDFRNIGNTVLATESKVMIGVYIDNLKIDIVKYKYPFIRDIINIDNIRLANPIDIAAMKLAAITGRGKKKDFIDLYFLLKHFSIEEIVQFYLEKYHDGNIFLVLRSLIYFEDADMDEDPVMLEKVSWIEMRTFIEDKVNKYLRTIN